MWTRTSPAALRSLRPRLHRTILFSRKYNGVGQGPPKTYFQPPPEPPKPPRRIFRSILLGTTCFVAGLYAEVHMEQYVRAHGIDPYGIDLETEAEQNVAEFGEALRDGFLSMQSVSVPPMDAEIATELLKSGAGFSVTPTAVSHTCQTASNIPCEDTWSSGTFAYFNDPKRDWSEWAIFDGHAGPATSHVLKQVLPAIVGDRLSAGGCLTRQYVPNDVHIVRVIQDAFKLLDKDVFGAETAMQHMEKGVMRRAETVSRLSNMLSGSCALMALFDPAREILRVANTGDSRAVLGRWENGKYVAHAMSADHTGFNQDEVERLRQEHPGEDVVDPDTGRVFGIAVTRAFADSRWKWPEEVTRRAHEFFWGPSPRPNGVVKTPPYLTAEPDVTEARIETGKHPDFLIMASDGLWDLMSNEDAVTCVQMWLEKNEPTNFLENPKVDFDDNPKALRFLGDKPGTNSRTVPFSFPDSEPDDDEDTYYDPDQRTLKWRVSPKHFVVEDDNAGVHLIKNAFGGKRKRLFESVMSVQPPLSRNVRDDVTVHVIFFGVDAEDAAKALAQGQGYA